MSLSEQDIQRIQAINVERVLKDIKYLSTGIVNNQNGVGRGSASAGSKEEHKLSRKIRRMMKKIGIDKVKRESFRVMTYKYSNVVFRANNSDLPAISLHGAGATYGTEYGKYFARGNTNDRTTVTGELVDAGLGLKQDWKSVV